MVLSSEALGQRAAQLRYAPELRHESAFQLTYPYTIFISQEVFFKKLRIWSQNAIPK